MIFEIYAQSIGIMYKKFNTCNMGRAKIQVDSLPPQILEGYLECDWGGYPHSEVVASHLAYSKYRVEINFLDDSHANSIGKEFMICGILKA